VDTSEAKIILLEGAPSVLPPFGPKLQRYTHRELEKMGVDIRVNTLAVEMDHDSIAVQAPGGRETIRASVINKTPFPVSERTVLRAAGQGFCGRLRRRASH
jgi:NADH dehydrogenase FAD-containing subunit